LWVLGFALVSVEGEKRKEKALGREIDCYVVNSQLGDVYYVPMWHFRNKSSYFISFASLVIKPIKEKNLIISVFFVLFIYLF